MLLALAYPHYHSHPSCWDILHVCPPVAHGPWRLLLSFLPGTTSFTVAGHTDPWITAHLQEVLLGDVHICTLVGQVVLGGHVLVEDVERHLDEGGVGHPGAVVAVLHFPQLVGLHLQVHCLASRCAKLFVIASPLPAACLPLPAGAVPCVMG